MSADSVEDTDWEEWFDRQYELNERIRRAVDGLAKDRGAGFCIALYSSVIEHAAERLREFIPSATMAEKE